MIYTQIVRENHILLTFSGNRNSFEEIREESEENNVSYELLLKNS
jgi:hypothetical protein